ncbi:MAG: hypothetical protein JW934_12500 [Anaerolineae bacterium]|nr:hypothetical protein [Anaerolineae bacterium]
MPYLYETEHINYADYASGAVFYGLSGTPTFPIRLAGEMFDRCAARLDRPGLYAIYDPCCGSGYLLATLAYFHWDEIGALIGSDVDERALSLAEANLSLLTVEGLDRRIAQIEQMGREYGKPSHQEALESAGRLKAQLIEHLKGHTISTHIFCADATDAQALDAGLQKQEIDIVLTDLPYGQHSVWQTVRPTPWEHDDPTWHMLDALKKVIAPHTMLAIASDKAQTAAHKGYRRLERFKLGKRQITLLQIARGT